jgi:DNA mismatch endonuclease (patch repair protein)
MVDVHDKDTRSRNMSQIRSRDTGPEMIVRKFLFAHGIRYRLYVNTLPGKPDIVIKKYKTIVDVRGCFWHGHKNCRFGDKVKTKSLEDRVQSALKRDEINEEKWRKLGWNVIIVWDRCELEARKKKSERREMILTILIKKLLKNRDTSN